MWQPENYPRNVTFLAKHKSRRKEEKTSRKKIKKAQSG